MIAPSDSASRSRPLGASEAASFLTSDEKRAAAGYDALGGRLAERESPSAKYTDDQPRVPAGQSGGGQWTDGGGGGSGSNDGRVRVAQARGGRDRSPILARFPGATPAQEARWAVSDAWARDAIARARRLDPNWRPTPEFSQTIEGEIRANEAQAREAEARLQELHRDAIPNTNPDWGVNRLTKELYDRGFSLDGPTRAPGLQYENSSGATVRIMERPRQRYRTDSDQKHYNSFYYRYRPGKGKPEGSHITIPDKPQKD